MAQPLYFLPNVRQAAADSVPLRRQLLQERGLADVFADVPLDEQPLAELKGRGPGDRPGCILYYQTPKGHIPRQSCYKPLEQTWTPVGDGALLWIGVDSAEPPTPEEMQRAKVCRGYPVELGDGNEWVVPVIRRHDPAKPTYLPSAFAMNGSGLVETVRASYRLHWEAFADVAAWVYGGMQEGKFAVADVVTLAVRALSINYRLGWSEQNVLQLVDTENFLTVVAAAVDLPGFSAVAAPKKTNESPGQSSTPGQPDDSPTTSPVGATAS